MKFGRTKMGCTSMQCDENRCLYKYMRKRASGLQSIHYVRSRLSFTLLQCTQPLCINLTLPFPTRDVASRTPCAFFPSCCIRRPYMPGVGHHIHCRRYLLSLHIPDIWYCRKRVGDCSRGPCTRRQRCSRVCNHASTSKFSLDAHDDYWHLRLGSSQAQR